MKDIREYAENLGNLAGCHRRIVEVVAEVDADPRKHFPPGQEHEHRVRRSG